MKTKRHHQPGICPADLHPNLHARRKRYLLDELQQCVDARDAVHKSGQCPHILHVHIEDLHDQLRMVDQFLRNQCTARNN